jgi:hypothetical protein
MMRPDEAFDDAIPQGLQDCGAFAILISEEPWNEQYYVRRTRRRGKPGTTASIGDYSNMVVRDSNRAATIRDCHEGRNIARTLQWMPWI